MENQTLVKEICPATAWQWAANGALFVDVRETEEVKELSYDVPNIIHIPLTQFEERFGEIPKNIEVVMVCRSGRRSLRAAGFLVNHGCDKVVNMKHGIIHWVEKGFPAKGDTASVLENSASKHSCCDSSSKSENSRCC